MTPILPVRVIHSPRPWPAVGAVILVAVALNLWASIIWPAAQAVSDPRMESACSWPRVEGAMTVVTVMDGKVVCWKWR